MITGHYVWDLAVKVWLPIAIALVVIGIAVTALMVKYRREERSSADRTEWSIGIVIMVLITLVIGGGTLLGFVPWAKPGHEFHGWNTVQGTVESATNRLISDGDHGVSQRYVIKFVEGTTLFGCDDSRCSQATVGKVIRLACKREWQYAAQSGWACRYDQAT